MLLLWEFNVHDENNWHELYMKGEVEKHTEMDDYQEREFQLFAMLLISFAW